MNTINAAAPLPLDGLLDPDTLATVESECVFQHHPAPKAYTSFDLRTEFAPVPASLAHVPALIADTAALWFGLPHNHLQPTVLRYGPGVAHDWHADASPRYPQSRHRTTSFSLLLNQHGQDYTGGALETEHGVQDLNAGDALIFTADTRHRVQPVTTGRRLVLVCFASQQP